MRLALGILLACTATVALAQESAQSITSPPPSTLAGAKKLPPKWEATGREIYKTAVETPTVAGRHNVPKLANYLADKFKAAGWAASDVHVLPYASLNDPQTAALIARWPSAHPTKKPLLILAHMDVV